MNPRFSLDWLISPTSKHEYFERYWEKQPLVVRRAQPDYFSSLLSFDDVDRVITTLDRRYPDISLKNAKNPNLSQADYTLSNGTLDVIKLYELFEQGSTITLAFLDTVLPALSVFCRSLEREFSCPLQTNIYMTPPGAQGAEPHYDTHDVFVLQVAGSKRWTIFGTPVESPLPGQRYEARVHQLGTPSLEFELEAGDLAFIPRGVAHEARSTDTISLHITAGILKYTWTDFLVEFIASTGLQNAAFRKGLPAGFARSGFDRTQARAVFDELLDQASSGLAFDSTLDSFIERFLSRCPPVLPGQLAQLAAVDSLTLETQVGARQGVVVRFEINGDSAFIDTYGRRITLPAHVGEAVQFALSEPKFLARDLPGPLDDPGKLTLVRRLIREGFVMILPVGHGS